MGRTAGLVRADGQIVTSAQNSDLIVLQRQDVNAADQYTPRLITAQDLLAGSGGTTYTPASVPFADSLGALTQDNTNLNFNDGTNTLLATNLDAGASGQPGSVDVFPTTASKGKLSIVAADSVGNTTTTITNASQAGARTYTVPDAGTDTSFVMAAGTQTIAGAKTFSSTVTTNGNLVCATAGGGLQIKTGTNATMGTVTLVAGVANVLTSAITNNSYVIVLTKQLGIVLSAAATYYVDNIAPGLSFTIYSSDPTDTGTVFWLIVEPI